MKLSKSWWLWMVLALWGGGSAGAQPFGHTNTVLRFQFTAGPNVLGNVDVELFDREKPVTVDNFLRYIESGRYTNNLLHRAVNNFIVQGGGFSVADPLSTNALTQLSQVRSFPRIVNEYTSGAIISNTFGTLAMARQGGVTNSANSEWFFNVADNLYLDGVDGGFTVFGRVLNDEGRDVLAAFAAYDTGINIATNVPVTDPADPSFSRDLDELPFATNAPAVLRYADAIVVHITILSEPFPNRDSDAPVLSVTAPTEVLVTSNQTMFVSGTATDDRRLNRVVYYVNDGLEEIASGFTNWTAEIVLNAGTNVVRCHSIDGSGNWSPAGVVTAVYQPTPIGDSNSIVRIHFRNYTNLLGSIDVELYDQDKPRTTLNFLTYITQGSYENSIIPVLQPRSILQSGSYTLPNADMTNEFLFDTGVAIPSLGPVTNELAFGRRLEHTNRTLAAAYDRQDDPNSGGAGWFLNLGDNRRRFSAVGARYTVFGRVLGTSNYLDPSQDLLAYFDSFTNKFDRYTAFGFLSAGIGAIPMIGKTNEDAISQFRPPKFFQMIEAEPEVIRSGLVDTIPPLVDVTSPIENFTTVESQTIFVHGTASDDTRIARILIRVNGGAEIRATGTTNWASEIVLAEGENVLSAVSVDVGGNRSQPVIRHYVYRPPPVTTNTLVRFSVSAGTKLLGSFDVELHDQDKPRTVENFLLYAYRGGYSNSLMHNLEPGVGAAGGLVTIPNPRLTNRFQTTLPKAVQKLGTISNEVIVGRRYSNVVGTLAAYKSRGQTNGAESGWILNLANNAILDRNDGGYTVFGRIVSSTNAVGPGSFVDFLNGRTRAGDVYRGFRNTLFDGLPSFRTNGVGSPALNELLVVNVSVIRGPRGERLKPAVTITYPKNGSRLTNISELVVTGTAKDPTGISRILFASTTSPFAVAGGTTNWSSKITLKPGYNQVFAQAIDRYGNLSAVAQSVFYHAIPVPFRLEVTGQGRVIGLTNGQMVEIDRAYQLFAVPAPGYFFAGWDSDDFVRRQDTSPLVFGVSSNMVLKASFIPNPFPRVKGSYAGFFTRQLYAVAPTDGTLNLAVDGNGIFRGSMTPAGNNYRISGRFNGSGNSAIGGYIGGTIPLVLELAIDMTNRIAGVYTHGNVGHNVQAERLAVFNATTFKCPLEGRYTISLPGVAGHPSRPAGDGVLNVVVSRLGKVTVTGNLGDGTPVTFTTSLTETFRWPFFQRLYANRGVIAGWMQFDPDLSGRLTGNLQWVKQSVTRDVLHSAGFTNFAVTAVGGRYVAPVAGTPALPWTNGVLVLSGGNLPSAVTNAVTWTNNRLVAPGTGLSNLVFNAASGLISGTYAHPGAVRPQVVRAVVLQGSNVISGYFNGTNRTGRIRIEAAP